MDNIAIKSSLPGFDADTCPDYQLLFSGVSPLLKIHMQGRITYNYVANSNINYEIDHGLGYSPFAMVYKIVNGISSPLYSFQITNQSIIILPEMSWESSSTDYYYYIFRLDLTRNFYSSILNSEPQSPSPSDDYGILVSKPGKDISSNDLRDFVIHKDARSLQIHQVSYVSANYPNQILLDIPHNLDYVPLVFAFVSYGGDYPELVYVTNGQESFISVTETFVTINSVSSGDGHASIVIFKDPFILE